ncbi:MAG TPA: YbaL family putative K(+) efflux transporter [Chiayiivirga sp.]|nr:YbaL family putative K(+) efflux transporter [Chiayiivirga sp.]
MPQHTDLIQILAIGLGLAFVLGFIANKLRLSPLVGYLLAGIVVGPYTPGFVGDADIAMQLADLGVMLLMFGVGLEFSLSDLLKVRWTAIPGAIVQATITTGVGAALSWSLGHPVFESLLFGFCLAIASTVVMLRTLEDRRLLDTRRGRIALGWLIVEDLICVLALVLLPVLAAHVGKPDESAAQSLHAIFKALLVTLVQVGAFVAAMLLVGKRVIPRVLEYTAGTGSRELFTLSVLAIAIGMAFGSAWLFGVSFALGAFFAGTVLKESEFSHKAANDSLPLRDAFAVLFFVSMGMLFDPRILLEHPLQLVATVLVILLGKSTWIYLIMRGLGHPKLAALTLSTGLAQIGEFSFILAGMGFWMHVLSAESRDLILAAALISITLNPLLLMVLDRFEARHPAQPIAASNPEPELPPGPVFEPGAHAIVIGYGRVGSQLTRLLRDRGINVVVIDINVDRVRRAHADGVPAIRGNAAIQSVLADAHPESAQIAIVVIPQVLEAGKVTACLRAANPTLIIFARAHSDAEVRHLIEHGADGAVVAERELAFSMAEMIMATPPYRKRTVPEPSLPSPVDAATPEPVAPQH